MTPQRRRTLNHPQDIICEYSVGSADAFGWGDSKVPFIHNDYVSLKFSAVSNVFLYIFHELQLDRLLPPFDLLPGGNQLLNSSSTEKHFHPAIACVCVCGK
jgi:hypothetical protein